MSPKTRAKKGGDLGEHERRRDFASTPEPAGRRRRREKDPPRFGIRSSAPAARRTG
jgi:hypothetical protein